MSGPGTARAQIFNARDHAHLTPWLAGLQAQCITSDKTISTFLPPLSHEKLLVWWKDRIAEATGGTRVIVMLLLDWEPGTRVQGDHLVGVAMLAVPHWETAPFRATIETLLLSTKYRRRGGATTLIKALETQALLKGKTLLMCEVEDRSPAADLFMRLNYQMAGTVPGYCINPSGELRGFVFLYKNIKGAGN
ncbi:hypothetical protein M406DRAFT_274202 [Cryphonectria parasitica EP155]|uniref:N-acetyltransferase domain-containing protein n=1 Tax=Cryphonectria parasitica (strain ATCC 38755 / EP155) TaxID=660469 RepID=A0A9P4Y510_CRYP1|nr:uncharacterized protein M406DRAFT_274202 [Cryphonectria parasitica EP155]KAF3766786.1 hypothetical protein M406DRAFT_274202 [Cryphonectria parasitica EP155]